MRPTCAADDDEELDVDDALERHKSKDIAVKFALYALKALILLGAAYGTGLLAQVAPPAVTGLAWALLSCAVSVAAAYPYVVRRMNTAGMYRPGSFIHNRVNGRLVILLVNIVVSALLVTSLVMEMQRWEGREWLVAVLSIPAYFAILHFMPRWTGREYNEPFVDRGTMLWGLWASGAILTLLYLLFTFAWPGESYSSLGDIFASTRQLFTGSPSELMTEVGKWEYVVQCLTLFGHDLAMKAPLWIGIVYNVVRCVLTAFAIAHLLTLCSMSPAQIRQVFRPLEHSVIGDGRSAAKNTAYFLVGFALLFGVFLAADAKAGKVRASEIYGIVEDSVRTQTNLTVYRVDGKNFAMDTVDETMAEVLESDTAARTARDELVEAVNAEYDECESKVDAYLDWYFNPLSGIQRLWNSLGNSATSKLREEYYSRIGGDLDGAAVQEQVAAYNATRSSLKEQVESRLQEDFEYGIPDWMAANVRTLDEFPQFQQTSADIGLKEPEGEYIGLTTDRDEYRQAIVDAIEESRAEALAQIE